MILRRLQLRKMLKFYVFLLPNVKASHCTLVSESLYTEPLYANLHISLIPVVDGS